MQKSTIKILFIFLGMLCMSVFSAQPTFVSAGQIIGNAFVEPFTFQGNHAATIKGGTATTVWWNEDNWDVRSDTAYNSAIAANGNEHIDIHHSNANLQDGAQQNIYALGGNGEPGVGVMHLHFEGVTSSRLRNPMLISPTQPGVVEFRTSNFLTQAHWWEIAIAPTANVAGGEITSIPHPGTGAVRQFLGPGSRPAIDSINFIAIGDERPCERGWDMHTGLEMSLGGIDQEIAGPDVPTDPSENLELYHWRIEYYPDSIRVFNDLDQNGTLELHHQYNVRVPWSEVYVFFLGVAYQADHHPGCWRELVPEPDPREIPWKDVKVWPVKYARTAAWPKNIGTNKIPQNTGWTSYDLRDTQRHTPSEWFGIAQPNSGPYNQHGSFAFCNGNWYDCNRTTASKTLTFDLPAVDATGISRAQLVYDIRGSSGATSGFGTLVVNGTNIGRMPDKSIQPGQNQDTEFAETSVDVPPSALRAGTNTITIALSGDVAFDRLHFELAYSGVTDTTPPSAPSGLRSTNRTQTQIDLSWSAAQDPESGIAGYNAYRNGVKLNTTLVASPSFSDSGLVEATSYTYEVSAVNNNNMEGQKSAAFVVSTLADTTAPTVASAQAAGQTQVSVVFSEPVEQATAANAANYRIDNNILVSGATLGTDLKTVTLTTSAHQENITYTLTVNSVRDRAKTPNTIQANTQATYTYAARVIISSLTVSNGKTYQAVENGLMPGALLYIDRAFTFSTIPPSLLGATYIQTANDDKSSSTNPFLEFTINRDATIYVVYDSRTTPLPSWLSLWTDTGNTIQTTDTPRKVYSKNYPAGKVSLGGNSAPGADSMYNVVIPAGEVTPIPSGAPYPASSAITGISFDWTTHRELAPGSDNWPVTWADDDHQYTSWGDGGGFGGTNDDGRVSLGVGRVQGDWNNYQGFNVWGGKNAPNPARFDGKSYGLISVQGVLYMWRTPGSDTQGYDEVRLARSFNHGATWELHPQAAFTKSQRIIKPAFLQFGKDYQGARDTYIYSYFIRLQGDPTSLGVHKPGLIDLARVPKDQIWDLSQYEWFAGFQADGVTPTWASNPTLRQPVFQDPTNGVGWNLSASYNAPLKRYLLTTEHDTTAGRTGAFGIFDAPEPWGPWTTVAYYDGTWAPASVGNTLFHWEFSNKWLSQDGKDFTMIFSGYDQGSSTNDSWNTVRGAFAVSGAPQLPKILVFHKTGDFVHGSTLSGVAAIKQLGAQNGFQVDDTIDASLFVDANLAQYAAVVFLNTHQEVLNDAQQAAFERYIRSGKGFVGVHIASGTEYQWPWYGDLVGARFNFHPAIQQATVIVEDRVHPSTVSLPAQWIRSDEWYNFLPRPDRARVHVLARVDESTYAGGDQGSDHPIAWCQNFDGGRSWYTSMGHDLAHYADSAFLSHILGGIQWAAGFKQGDCTPQPFPQPPGLLPLRINAGGGQITDARGRVWRADQAYTAANQWGYVDTNGDAGQVNTGLMIANTDEDTIFASERWAMEEYRADVPNGVYDMRLYFAETWTGVTAPGQRVFDVSIEGKRWLDDFDVFEEAGFAKALVKEIRSIPVTDGQLNVVFESVIENTAIKGLEIGIASTLVEPPPLNVVPTPSINTLGNLHVFLDRPYTLQIVGTDFSPSENFLFRLMLAGDIKLELAARPTDLATVPIDFAAADLSSLAPDFYDIELERESNNDTATHTQKLLITKLGDLWSKTASESLIPLAEPRDAKVDTYDVSRLLLKWGTADADADINAGPAGISAGVVDIFDANKMMANWNP